MFDMEHLPHARDLIWDFLDAKIPLTADDLARLHKMDEVTIQDHLDGLVLHRMLRPLGEGDHDPYVLTWHAMEMGALFDHDWDKGVRFWEHWQRVERRMAFRDATARARKVAAVGAGIAGVAAAGAGAFVLRRRTVA